MSFQSLISNFALILFVLMVVTGVIWAFDRFVLLPKRKASVSAALQELERNGNSDQTSCAQLEANMMRQPVWVEYSGSFFPVIALVFVLRSFLFEPFKIPSGSMLPTLYVGDFILVNKFTYGIRLPILDKKIISVNEPQRGDVMVFRFPKDPSQNYIKRIVGLPGDTIVYKNKKLIVNGVESQYESLPDFLHEGPQLSYSKQLNEKSGSLTHRVLNDDDRPAGIAMFGEANFPYADQCIYEIEGVTCKVPADHYFMMGDNRDNSQDSRYWGFVPDQNIVGKAFFIWMNFSDLKRVGSFQ
ncbi:signal peptidase I [Undibacterium macrobrachii]|jgi:signal peptidase I|uniref:Signal peptidase I n=1 Tax=Undibacterium macrobrachii TaxID=1119058 RepID=A0ABQ2XK40_9BURK|nr:signal peptidase I [Undibacterium macrobrachii]GGX19970.1 signal peptidase I [Undibacterium macrobrachii]